MNRRRALVVAVLAVLAVLAYVLLVRPAERTGTAATALRQLALAVVQQRAEQGTVPATVEDLFRAADEADGDFAATARAAGITPATVRYLPQARGSADALLTWREFTVYADGRLATAP
jgi:Tfp pilus assembly protein PilE